MRKVAARATIAPHTVGNTHVYQMYTCYLLIQLLFNSCELNKQYVYAFDCSCRCIQDRQIAPLNRAQEIKTLW